MSKTILLLNPPGPKRLYRDTSCDTLSKANYVWKPKGHILFSTIIPADWEYNFIDASIDSLSPEQVYDAIAKNKPNIIVMAMSSVIWDQDLAFLKEIKNMFPDIYCIVFGSLLIDKLFFDIVMQYADEVVYDPLTYDLRNYNSHDKNFEMIKKAQGNKKPTFVKSFSPKHELFDGKGYRWPFIKHFKYAPVYTQFGCPYSCSYCPQSLTSVTVRYEDDVKNEIKNIYDAGYKEIHFGDETFGSPKDYVKKLLNWMIKENFNLSWSGYTYPGLIEKKFLEVMKLSGCHTLVIGIDSADFNLLKEYGRNVKKERTFQFISDCHELNIDVCGDFILGLEGEDERAVLKTIDFAVSCGVDYASFNVAQPLAGSILRDKIIKAGIIDEKSIGHDTAGFNMPGSSMINSKHLKELHSLAVRRFYLRPKYIIKRLSKIRSIEEFALRSIEGLGVLKNAMLTI
jgi:radical SAM superfamily enzyme YgiQ (UPF0313 family)